MTGTEFLERSARLGLRPRRMLSIIALALALAAFEALGVGMMLPVLQFVQERGDLAKLSGQGRLWTALLGASTATGIPITLASLLALSFVLLLVRQAMTYAQLMYTAGVRSTLAAETRSLLFRAFLGTSLSRQEREPIGALINDVTVEVESAVACLLLFLHQVALALLAAAYFALLLVVSPVMTLAALVMFIASALFLRRLVTRGLHVGEMVTESNRSLGAFLTERLRSLRLIRLSNTEAAEAAALDQLTDGQRRHRLHIESLNARLQVTLEPIFVAFCFVLLYFGATSFGMQLEEIGLFLIVMLRLVPLGKDVMRARQNVLQLTPSLRAVCGRLDRLEADAERSRGAARPGRTAPTVRFENVAFDYDTADEGKAALDDVSFVAHAGSFTALVGPSGGGKSTTIDLMAALRTPKYGQIFIDEVDIRELALPALRNAIAYVPQSPQLFDVTFADHIRYGRPQATDAEVREAAQQAGALSFIEAMPKGFGTRIGEAGVHLSGGQRQRLDLARALVRKSPILLLDEPTSNLDADAEEAILQFLRGVQASRAATTIVVTHRLSTAAVADQIVVMKSGRVIESGTHDQLLATSGWYAEAFRRQTEFDDAEHAERPRAARARA